MQETIVVIDENKIPHVRERGMMPKLRLFVDDRTHSTKVSNFIVWIYKRKFMNNAC